MTEDDGHKIEFKPVLKVPAIRTLTRDKVEHEKQWIEVVNFIEYESCFFLNLFLKMTDGANSG